MPALTKANAREIVAQFANEYFLDFCQLTGFDPDEADTGQFDIEVEDGVQDENLVRFIDRWAVRFPRYLANYGYRDADEYAHDVRVALCR